MGCEVLGGRSHVQGTWGMCRGLTGPEAHSWAAKGHAASRPSAVARAWAEAAWGQAGQTRQGQGPKRGQGRSR